MDLKDSVEGLDRVGPKMAGLMKRLKIKTIKDLIEYFPRTYNDYSLITPIVELEPGEVSIRGVVETVKSRYVRRGLHITEAIIADNTGKIKAVWFNQPYLSKSLPKDKEVFLSGKYDLAGQNMSLQNPSWEKTSDFPTNAARILPIYKETKGLTSYQLRKLLGQVLPAFDQVKNTLPESKYLTINKSQTLRQLHFPGNTNQLEQAQDYMAYEELFTLIAASSMSRRQHQSFQAPKIVFDKTLASQFIESLPFKLTDAQRASSWQILQDIERNVPANRLVEGDVGSGKTVVAAMTALQVIRAGYQVAIIAPTEILAQQHAESLSKTLAGFDVAIGLLTGGVKSKPRESVLAKIKSGEAQLVIGTHALIEPTVIFKNLGFVVVDEQHRFGVKQREKLQLKSELMPHLLSMTATPIPRSLALTVYGDLDVSVIDEMPKGRLPIKTKLVRQSTREAAYKHIDDQIIEGRQVYIICPLVEDSDFLGVKSVETEYARLQTTIFKHRRIGLLHGRMKPVEKDQIMLDYKAGKYDILVSTTVVEVGVDVPNASVIMIEAAERFGLAQLHQLRGRVGRSDKQSYCYLVPSNDKMISKRLRAMEQTTDGFKLAELDLKLRGPGAIYGTRQHGQLDLRFAKLTDRKLIAQVQKDVKQLLDNDELKNYPELMQKINAARAVTQLN
ncbi:ATP-dependent DNA helicase RecG [Candidatus Saccharibacteria bacterium]|nr:ATP-dependent DNA helicase RecG [Candidatus Saccharibacteria bacterium]MBP9132190.1 ATP-dependent DNA helicase RecG [Candidatus Saccharibacteria bacterium]